MPGPFFWVVVLIGLATLATAAQFAFRPAERTLAVLRPLCAATVFTALAVFLLGLANGLVAASRLLGRPPEGRQASEVWQLLLPAFAEAPAPLILGFAAVGVAWLLAAVGLRRQA